MVKGHDSAKAPARKAPARRGPSRHPLVFDRTPPMATTPLRKVAKSLWGRLRRRLLEKHGLVCMACGHVPPKAAELEGHEVHSFPGDGVIRLELILLLCRKCHHTVHLERSVSWERDGARRKWQEEHPLPLTRKRRRVSELEEFDRQAWNAGDEAAAVYREAMLKHYCKVNGVPRRQCERDYERALPPEDIMQLRKTRRAAWKEAAKNDPDLLRRAQPGEMILPDFTHARMDYGPFEDEMEKSRAVVEERRERRAQAVLVELDDPEITEQWNRMTPDERRDFDGPEDFANMVWGREDAGFELFPDHECPWDIAMLRNG